MRSIIVALPIAFLAACASTPTPDDGAVASDSAISSVDPAQCPRELRVQVGAGFAELDPGEPQELSGANVDPAQWDRFLKAKKEADVFWSSGPIVVEANNPVKTADTCTYSAAHGTTAVLRTLAGGGVELQITRGLLSVIAHPRRLAPEGIRFIDDEAPVDLLAVIADAPARLASIGKVSVDATGEQIARFASLSAVRLPILQTSLDLLYERNPKYGKTMVIDAEHGSAKYMRFAQSIEDSSTDAVLTGGSPHMFETKNPDTTMCFLGPADGICAILSTFGKSVFTDSFEVLGDEGGMRCKATDSEVTMFYSSYTPTEADGSIAVIPRCK